MFLRSHRFEDWKGKRQLPMGHSKIMSTTVAIWMGYLIHSAYACLLKLAPPFSCRLLRHGSSNLGGQECPSVLGASRLACMPANLHICSPCSNNLWASTMQWGFCNWHLHSLQQSHVQRAHRFCTTRSFPIIYMPRLRTRACEMKNSSPILFADIIAWRLSIRPYSEFTMWF